MKPRGPLMIEHRLIEKVVDLLRNRIPEIRAVGGISPGFVEAVIDFMRFYTDATHHGKEEEIYFRDCAKKDLPEDERQLMEDLIREHELSRQALEGTARDLERYRRGEDVLGPMLEKLQAWVEIYPRHIEKEDRYFFPAVEKYFSEPEEQAMLAEFGEFDRKLIHTKYRAVVEALKRGR